MANNRWTIEELQRALNLYLVTPFGKIHSNNPDIISLSKEIGRSNHAVALKMVNFASLDPTINRQGMSNVSKLDRQVWDNFFSKLGELDDSIDSDSNGLSDQIQTEYQFDNELIGRDVLSVVKSRRGQSLFRRMVLSSYDNKCALSSISHSSLLIASHIDPWASNTEKRLHPTNGICLCSLLDSAFEHGLIVVSNQYEVLVSANLNDYDSSIIRAIASPRLRFPSRFLPDVGLLNAHRSKFSGKYLPL
jgi:putative restriction endonuclease